MSMSDKEVRAKFLFEKFISLGIAFVLSLIAIIGWFLLGYVERIDKNFTTLTIVQKESNDLARQDRLLIRSDLSELRQNLQARRDRAVEVLSEHKTQIHINEEKIKNLEKAVYK